MVSYIHTNLPVNAIVRLLHPWSGKKQGQETFLAPSADIRNTVIIQSVQTAIPPYQYYGQMDSDLGR